MFLSDTDQNEFPEALNKIRTFCDISPVGISFLDQKGNILFANQTELDLVGYDSRDYIGKNITRYHEEKSTLQSIIAALSSGKDFKNREAVLKCRDGSSRDVLISSIVTRETPGRQITICFTRDITYLKKSEKYLKLLNKVSEDLSSLHDTNEALDKITALIVPQLADWVVINELRSDGKAHLLKMAHVDPEKVNGRNNIVGNIP